MHGSGEDKECKEQPYKALEEEDEPIKTEEPVAGNWSQVTCSAPENDVVGTCHSASRLHCCHSAQQDGKAWKLELERR